jgi:Aromatic-ring-opening dioxygenase LigAB, LigA subunit
MKARYRVHGLIHALDCDAELVQRFRVDPDALFSAWELSDAERSALLEGTIESLTRAGVHPLMCIRYLRARFPERPAFMSINDCRERLLKEPGHG